MNLTSHFQRCNSVAIVTFGAYWELKLLSEVEATLPCKFDVIRSTLRRGCKFDAAISTLQQRCQYTTFMIHLDMNLLSNIEATLEQLCNFDVMAPASVQRVLVVRRCDLTATLSQRFTFAG